VKQKRWFGRDADMGRRNSVLEMALEGKLMAGKVSWPRSWKRCLFEKVRDAASHSERYVRIKSQSGRGREAMRASPGALATICGGAT
jgi:hypothetical protein